MAGAKFAVVTERAIGFLLGDDPMRAGSAHVQPFVGFAGEKIDGIVDDMRSSRRQPGERRDLTRQTPDGRGLVSVGLARPVCFGAMAPALVGLERRSAQRRQA